MRKDFLYVENNNVVKVLGLVNTDSKLPETAAIVRAYLVDDSGSLVPGQAWPLQLVHTENGTYEGTLSHTLDLNTLGRYRLKITAESPDGNIATWESDVRAIYRSIN